MRAGGVIAPRLAACHEGKCRMYELVAADVTVVLPSFQKIETGVMREASKLEETEQIWFILENVLPAKELKALYKLPLDEFTEHIKAWTGGARPGES